MNKVYRPTAAIILINKQDKYLVVRSAKDENAWYFPQGGIKTEESIPVAIKRELKEELSINFDEYKIINTDLYSAKLNFNHKSHFKGKKYFFVQGKYIGDGKIILNKDEISNFKWASKEECEELFKKGPKDKYNILKSSLKQAN